MKSNNTYSLLVNSQERGRNIFEIAVYGLVAASMVFSVFAFASQAVTFAGKIKADTEVQLAASPAPQLPLIASRR